MPHALAVLSRITWRTRLDHELKMIFNFSMHQQPCPRRVLSLGDFASIEECACGSVHLNVGAVTLRLQASAFAAFAAVVEEAARAHLLARVRREAAAHEALS
jgi:hypothetical protein